MALKFAHLVSALPHGARRKYSQLSRPYKILLRAVLPSLPWVSVFFLSFLRSLLGERDFFPFVSRRTRRAQPVSRRPAPAPMPPGATLSYRNTRGESLGPCRVGEPCPAAPLRVAMRSPLPFPCVPDRPSKILLVQVGTLSFSHPSFGVSVLFRKLASLPPLALLIEERMHRAGLILSTRPGAPKRPAALSVAASKAMPR